jgi:hypothetical protein
MTRVRILAGALVVSVLAYAWWATGTACPFALVTGIPCPGCGLGRATLALLAGHPIDAFRFYPMVFVVVPALIGFFTFPPAMRTWAAAVLLIAVFGVWIARFGGAFGGPVSVRSAWTATR